VKPPPVTGLAPGQRSAGGSSPARASSRRASWLYPSCTAGGRPCSCSRARAVTWLNGPGA